MIIKRQIFTSNIFQLHLSSSLLYIKHWSPHFLHALLTLYKSLTQTTSSTFFLLQLSSKLISIKRPPYISDSLHVLPQYPTSNILSPTTFLVTNLAQTLTSTFFSITSSSSRNLKLQLQIFFFFKLHRNLSRSNSNIHIFLSIFLHFKQPQNSTSNIFLLQLSS